MEPGVLESIFDGSIQPRDVKLSVLESITENFSEERIIGDGGFATVYKGVLPNGEVAVKRIKNIKTIDEKLFRREVTSLLKVNHKNIVRFLGYCSHTEHKAMEKEGSGEVIYAEDRERLLCFEYINNGSLAKYIADELRGLQWDTRYSIIKGICEGLHYLHMTRHILHMDLKPANILIDDSMVAKITDFGLSRMAVDSQTKTKERYISPGYTAPEYIDIGSMTFKNDVYSLGIIIIELVTGKRSIPDSNNVLRRWRHRWHKSGKETPFRYQQITKLIEIGLQCQEKDPYKRPFISNIISDIHKLESTDGQISNTNKSTVGQISPCSEDDMLGIEPLELHFPIELNTQISSSLELTNETNAFFAFSIQTTSPLPYCIQPNKYIVAPRSNYSVKITLQPLDHAAQDWHYTGDFIVRSTKVNASLTSVDITEDIFNREGGKLVDEVNLTIAYKAEVRQVDVSLGSLTISDTRNQHDPNESNVPPAEAEAKTCSSSAVYTALLQRLGIRTPISKKKKQTCSSISDKLIQFDPPELHFPFLPNKKVLSSIKIVNLTDYNVGFHTYSKPTNAAWYHTEPPRGILPPRSTQKLMVTRHEKENYALAKDNQLDDKYFVWKRIVNDGVKDCELSDYMADQESTELPIVHDKISSITSDELIQLDPAELCMPQWPKKMINFVVNVVNTTDFNVAFNVYTISRTAARHKESEEEGILPPRSTKRCILYWIIDDGEPVEDYFVWNRVVTESVESGDIVGYMVEEESKKLPFIINKVSPCPSNGLINFDPPELNLPFMPNKPLLFSVNVVNNTDYFVGFGRYHPQTNVGMYYILPAGGVMTPWSTKRLTVKRVPQNKEREDMHCQDKFFLWTCLVSEGAEASDFFNYIDYEESKELPIVYKKTSLCASDELIQFDPPQLHFDSMPNKRASMFHFFKIVNVTDHNVGFNTWFHEDNSAMYRITPHAGILPPQSTETIKLKRTLKENERDDLQCKDKIFVWNGIVTEGVEVSDVSKYWKNKDKKLPVVFTKTCSSISDMLIQFDPPELHFPFLPNKKVLSSIKIVNLTDYNVGFHTYSRPTNAAWYHTEPPRGILLPRSTQKLMVTREEKENYALAKDNQLEDKYFVWKRIVNDSVKDCELSDYVADQESTELPIVHDKISSITSDELIQLDPAELCMPQWPNKKIQFLVNVVNTTDFYVAFNVYIISRNAARYKKSWKTGILPPRSSKRCMLPWIIDDGEPTEDWFVWNRVVTEGVENGDIVGYMVEEESKKLPFIINKVSPCPSNELIHFDPADISVPFVPNKPLLFSVNIVNNTDYYVGFNRYHRKTNVGMYFIRPKVGVMAPWSTQRLTVKRVPRNKEREDMHCQDKFFLWTCLVSEGTEASDIVSYNGYERSKELPIGYKKTSLCASDELIQFDPPQLQFNFSPDKKVSMLSLFKIVNVTDHTVGFSAWSHEDNSAEYAIVPEEGILLPRSTQTIEVRRTRKENVQEDMQCKDKIFVWNGIVTEGVEVSDVGNYWKDEDKELPVVLTKAQ